MWYEYRCDTCGDVYETQTFRRIGKYLDRTCPNCQGGYVRIVSMPQITPPPKVYFNHTVGQMVTSNRDFEEKLRIGGEKQAEKTGVETRYVPLYPSEGRAHVEKVGGDYAIPE